MARSRFLMNALALPAAGAGSTITIGIGKKRCRRMLPMRAKDSRNCRLSVGQHTLDGKSRIFEIACCGGGQRQSNCICPG